MKDIVYTRKYTGKDGQERKEYILIGYIFEKDGRELILMKNYINPAALANDKGEVWLSVYEHKTREVKGNGSKSLYKGTQTVNTMTDAAKHKAAVESREQSTNVISDEEPFIPF